MNLNKKHIFILALCFLIGLFTLNFIVRQVTKERILSSNQEKFQEMSLDISHLVEKRAQRYEDLVLLGRKLFEGSTSVSRSEFEHFFAEYFQRRRDVLGGVEHIAYVEHVTDKKAFVNRVRSEKTTTPYKFLYFNVLSTDGGDSHYIFNYLYPHTDASRFFGYDTSDSQELERAFRQAAREGKTTLSNTVNLFGMENMMIIEPIYMNDGVAGKTREQMVSGFIVLILKKESFFDNIFEYQTEESEKINISVAFTDNPRYVFYEDINIGSHVFAQNEPLISDIKKTRIFDRNIQIKTESKKSLQLTLFERFFPDVNFVVSTLVALIYFIIMITFRMRCDSEN